MLSTLDVPYTDANATELVWTLGQPLVPALSTTAVTLREPESSLELRVLGASHQVAMSWPGGELTETVACLPTESPYLPSTTTCTIGGRRYVFRARVEEVPAGELRSTADALRRLAAHEGTPGTTVLAAAFPTEPDALTALSVTASDSHVSWNTWHIYPNTRQIVTTSTEVL